MRMSANENESVDIHLYTNRRSNSIDWEEINRMERPSRVFSTRHNLMSPAVGGWSHTHPIEPTEQYRRPRDNSYYYESPFTSARTGGNITNGDTARNRSPFVRFTITDPETQQITAAGQIPLNSPPTTTQANIITSNAELIADDPTNETSDDEYLNLNIRRHNIEQHRRYMEHYNAMAQTTQQSRNSRSGRRSRRYTEHPYFMRNNLDSPSNGRSLNSRRVRFSSSHRGYNDIPHDRPLTPEQQLPQVLGNIEPVNRFEEVYLGQDTISSVSSHNDADSSDERRSTQFSPSENQNSQNSNADEDNGDISLDIPNEVPRTRVVPFIMSPLPLPMSYRSQIDPPDPLEPPLTSTNNNMSAALQYVENPDDLTADRDVESPLLTPYMDYSETHSYMLLRSNLRSDAIDRTNDTDLNTVNNTTDETVDETVDEAVDEAIDEAIDETVDDGLNANETADQNDDDNQNIIMRPPPWLIAQGDEQAGVAEETATAHHLEEHPESYEELNDQLTRLFECPVCFEHIAPPILQCLFGHLICNKCVVRCDNCPTCRNPFNSKRNLYMEKVGYLIKFPCKNSLTGCKQQLFLSQQEAHEQECCYKHYQCFFNNCNWKGYYPEMHVHMVNNHSSCILKGPDKNFEILLPNSNQTYKWFLIAHNEYFAVIAQVSVPPKFLKIQVTYLGPDVKAKQFKFTLKLTQPKARNGTQQDIRYSRTTLPYSDICNISKTNMLNRDIFYLSDMLERFTKRKQSRLPVNLKVEPVSSL